MISAFFVGTPAAATAAYHSHKRRGKIQIYFLDKFIAAYYASPSTLFNVHDGIYSHRWHTTLYSHRSHAARRPFRSYLFCRLSHAHTHHISLPRFFLSLSFRTGVHGQGYRVAKNRNRSHSTYLYIRLYGLCTSMSNINIKYNQWTRAQATQTNETKVEEDDDEGDGEDGKYACVYRSAKRKINYVYRFLVPCIVPGHTHKYVFVSFDTQTHNAPPQYTQKTKNDTRKLGRAHRRLCGLFWKFLSLIDWILLLRLLPPSLPPSPSPSPSRSLAHHFPSRSLPFTCVVFRVFSERTCVIIGSSFIAENPNHSNFRRTVKKKSFNTFGYIRVLV